MPSKPLTILQGIVEVNFYLSVVVLISGCVLSISESASVFEFNVDLYGPLANNLRMILVYLALTEVFLCAGCFLLNKPQFFLLIGLSLVLMIGSLEVYSTINDIEKTPIYRFFSLIPAYPTSLSGCWLPFGKRIFQTSRKNSIDLHHSIR